MKMNYLLKTNHSSSRGNRGRGQWSLRRIVVALIVAVIALWWIFFTPTFMAVTGHGVARAVTSLYGGATTVVHTVGSFFFSKAALLKTNEQLRDKLFAQEVEMVNLELIKQQGIELKESLNRIGKTDLIAAAVIRSVAASPYDTFLIDGGRAAGISAGDIVLVHSAVPVGYISKVFAQSAEVTMYSSPGETIEGVLTFNEGKGAPAIPTPLPSSATSTTGTLSSRTSTANTSLDTDTESRSGSGRLRKLFVSLVGRGGGNFDVRLTKEIDVPIGALIAMPGLNARLLATVYGGEFDAAGSSRVLHALSPVNMLHESIVYIEPAAKDE